MSSAFHVNCLLSQQQFAQIMKGTHLINDNDVMAAEIDKFTEVLELHQNLIFGDALCILNKTDRLSLGVLVCCHLKKTLPSSKPTLLVEYEVL